MNDNEQPPSNDETPPAAADNSAAPADPLAAAEAEKKAMHERMLRIAAEFDNWKKRARKDQADAEIRAREGVLRDTLEVIDNLERAVTSISETTSVPAIKEGIGLVLRFLQQKLERYEVRPFDAKGKPFDPRLHEAIARVPTVEVEAGSVANERQKGYLIGERLLRPALVEVAVAPPSADPIAPPSEPGN